MKYPIVAEHINYILELRNMSQQDLSDLSNVGKSSISHYANGTYSPGNVTAAKLARTLVVNPLWLMGYPVPMKMENPEEKSKEDVEVLESFSKLSKEDRSIVLDLIKSMLSKNEDGA